MNYVEISENQCYGDCCRISNFESTNRNPDKCIDIFPKVVCKVCGRQWCTYIGNRWRYRPKLKSMGYTEDEKIFEITNFRDVPTEGNK